MMLSSVRQSFITKTSVLESVVSKRCSNMLALNVQVSRTAATTTNVRRGFHYTAALWKHGSYNVHHDEHTWYGTTIVCIRKNGRVCMIGDGQVTQGSTMVKGNARKIRRIKPKVAPDTTDPSALSNQGTIAGFAGSTADAFTLLDRLEEKLEEYPGQLDRACVELAKGWRSNKYLRQLEAAVLVANERQAFEVTGHGDVLESSTGVLGIGSGSVYAIAAARALMDIPELSAEDVASKAMAIASDMCVYTNSEYVMDSMEIVATDETEEAADLVNSKPADVTQVDEQNDKKEDNSDSDSDSDNAEEGKKDNNEDDSTKH